MEPKTIFGLLVAAAIPVVMFALWCEYFRKEIRSEEQEDPRDSSEEEGVAERLARIRLAGLMATVLQLIVFLSTSDIRREDEAAAVAGIWFTLMGLVGQRWIQIQLEREAIPSREEATGETASSLLPRGIIWAFAGMAIYMGVLVGCVVASAVAVAIFKIEGAGAAAVIGIGAVAGYSFALASNFMLSPWLFKKMMPSEEVSHPVVLQQLNRWFEESGVSAPEFRQIQSKSVKSVNAWVTGFPGFRGFLRPVLWLTPKMAEDFGDRELHSQLEAVIKHEAAHMRLGHLKKRLILAWSMSMIVLFTMAGSLAMNAFFRAQAISSVLPLFSMVAAFGLLWASFRVIQKQARSQELEADLFCVTELGARASRLIAALERIEKWNGLGAAEGAPLAAGSHPATEERIRALQDLAAKEELENARAVGGKEDKIAA